MKNGIQTLPEMARDEFMHLNPEWIARLAAETSFKSPANPPETRRWASWFQERVQELEGELAGYTLRSKKRTNRVGCYAPSGKLAYGGLHDRVEGIFGFGEAEVFIAFRDGSQVMVYDESGQTTCQGINFFGGPFKDVQSGARLVQIVDVRFSPASRDNLYYVPAVRIGLMPTALVRKDQDWSLNTLDGKTMVSHPSAEVLRKVVYAVPDGRIPDGSYTFHTLADVSQREG
jgi:hypothetical protein